MKKKDFESIDYMNFNIIHYIRNIIAPDEQIDHHHSRENNNFLGVTQRNEVQKGNIIKSTVIFKD